MNKTVWLLFALMFFCMVSFIAPAQTGGRGRYGAEDPETPKVSTGEGAYRNRWLYLGLRAGPSLGIYIPSGDTGYTGGDSYGASLTAAFQAAVEIIPLVSIQAEALFTWDHGSLWQYEFDSAHKQERYQPSYKAPSLQFPLLAKLNFYPGKFQVSPFAGAYFILPLGKVEIDDRGNEGSYDYSYSLPLGLLGGLSVAFPLGPGRLFADMRYSADLSDLELQDSGLKTYTRHTAALSLGYEIDFFTKGQSTGSAK
jgi:hypothetical protein